MRRPARNLFYSVLGVLCVALLVQAIGLPTPALLRVLTAVSRAPEPSSRVPISAAARLAESCTALSSIERALEPEPITGGSFLWFRSSIRVDGLGSEQARLFLSDSTITYEAGGSSHNISVPA